MPGHDEDTYRYAFGDSFRGVKINWKLLWEGFFFLGGGEAFRNEVKEWSDSGTRKEKCFAFLAYKEIYPPNKKNTPGKRSPKTFTGCFSI